MSKFKFSKRGALNLGISTVVVLVIAMVVIGAGVSFIRTFFAEGTDSLIGAFDSVQDIGLSPDRESPFLLETSSIQLKQEETASLSAGFYNAGTEEKNVTIDLGSCSGNLGDNMTITSVNYEVPSAESVGFNFLIETDGASIGDYICSIVIKEAEDGGSTLASKSLTVSIDN